VGVGVGGRGCGWGGNNGSHCRRKAGLTAAAAAASKPTTDSKPSSKPAEAKKPGIALAGSSSPREETKVPMSRMRQRIAERMIESQSTYASLTTFNEIDMSNCMELREKFKDEFFEKHGVKLGFMSFFVKAATQALISNPDVNAVIEGTNIVYRNYVDISVAVATPTGLVSPMSWI